MSDQQETNEAADGQSELTAGLGLMPCPFCGTTPTRRVSHDILHVECPQCVSVGFHNHVRFGCRADEEWNTRTPNV